MPRASGYKRPRGGKRERRHKLASVAEPTRILICIDRKAADLDKLRDRIAMTSGVFKCGFCHRAKGGCDVSIRGSDRRFGIIGVFMDFMLPCIAPRVNAASGVGCPGVALRFCYLPAQPLRSLFDFNLLGTVRRYSGFP